MIREELPHSLEVGLVRGHGLWVGDQLVAVDAWRTERDPAVRYRWGDQVWLNVILAVHADYRRRGLARRLKLALVEEARHAGIVAITSIVAWTNIPMLSLNEKLGASRDYIITDVEPDPAFCRCLIPLCRSRTASGFVTAEQIEASSLRLLCESEWPTGGLPSRHSNLW